MATKTKCGRCGGKGGIDAYRHIDGGRCMACKGSGSIVKADKVPPAEALAREIAERTAAVESRKAHLATCTTRVTIKIAQERLDQAEKALAVWTAKGLK